MNNRILSIIVRHKQIIALSIMAIAMAVYIFPLDSFFADEATAAKGGRGGGSGPYGHFGPAPGQGGQNPGQGGGSPPGQTPGGSNTPPGLQRGS